MTAPKLRAPNRINVGLTTATHFVRPVHFLRWQNFRSVLDERGLAVSKLAVLRGRLQGQINGSLDREKVLDENSKHLEAAQALAAFARAGRSADGRF